MPVIPHFASESLELFNYEGEIKWPSIEKDLLLEENINYVIQINGKKRGLVVAKRDLSEENLFKLINEKVEISKFIENKIIKKRIFVTNKLMNIIV